MSASSDTRVRPPTARRATPSLARSRDPPCAIAAASPPRPPTRAAGDAVDARAPANVPQIHSWRPVRLSPRYDVSYSDGGGRRRFAFRGSAPRIRRADPPPPRLCAVFRGLRREGGERGASSARKTALASVRISASVRIFSARATFPGALDDVIMLDSESPMFPSCVWSDPTHAYPPRHVRRRRRRRRTRARRENTNQGRRKRPGSASSDVRGRVRRRDDEWVSVRPRGRSSAKNDRDAIRTDSFRPEAEASLARSYSLASLPLAIDDASRRDAAAVAKRDIAEWQPAGTSLYVGARANAFAFARPRRPSSPLASAAAAGSRDARAVPPGTTERLGVRGFRRRGGGGRDGRRRARLCLGGGDAFRAREPTPLRWSELAFGPTQSAARDEDDDVAAFDALSEGDDVERSIKLSDELSDEDEESVDVRPYAPGVSLEALVRARDDDLTVTLARGGRTGGGFRCDPRAGSARRARRARRTCARDVRRGRGCDVQRRDGGERGGGARGRGGAPGGVEADQNLVRKQEDDAETHARGVDPCAATTAARERASASPALDRRGSGVQEDRLAQEDRGRVERDRQAFRRRSSCPDEGSRHGVKRGRRWSSFGSVDFDADVDAAAARRSRRGAAELRARTKLGANPSSALTRDMSWADIHAALTNARRR